MGPGYEGWPAHYAPRAPYIPIDFDMKPYTQFRTNSGKRHIVNFAPIRETVLMNGIPTITDRTVDAVDFGEDGVILTNDEEIIERLRSAPFNGPVYREVVAEGEAEDVIDLTTGDTTQAADGKTYDDVRTVAEATEVLSSVYGVDPAALRVKGKVTKKAVLSMASEIGIVFPNL